MAGGNSYLDNLRLGQNPVLTNLAMGYSNAEFIADKIFPVIPTTAFPTLRVPEMNRDHLKIISDVRTLYGDAVEGKNGALTYADVSLREHTQKRRIDIQEQINASVIDLRKTRTFALTEGMLLNIEKDVADIVQNNALYVNSNTTALAGVDQWTHASSHPETQIWDAMEVVRGLCGHRPNTMTLGATSAWALMKNANMVLAIKGALGGGIVSLQEIANYFNLTNGIHVGAAIYDNSEVVTDTFAPVDLWTDDCCLAYVATAPSERRSMYIPSFGYTFKHSQFAPSIKTWQDLDGLTEWVQGSMIWVNKMYNDACAYLYTDTNVAV